MRDARNIILLNIQHRAILYQHITIMNIQDSSFIITQFGTGKCVIRDSAIKHFIKLTLFPRRSSSLFICGQDKPVRPSGKGNALTLMKGDKVVELAEILSNHLLLIK